MEYNTKLSKSSISLLENGDVDPKLDSVIILTDYFGVKGQYSFGEVNEES